MISVTSRAVLSVLGALVLAASSARVSPVLFAQRKAADGPIAESTLRAHMDFLAGDAMNGRGSGTRDEWIAATYIGSHLQRWGIEPLGDNGGFVQAVDTPRATLLAPAIVSAGEKIKLVHGKDVLVQAIGAAHAAGPLVKFTKGGSVPPGAVVLQLGPDAPDAAAANAAAAVLIPETEQVRARWDTAAAASRFTLQAGRPWRVVLDPRSFLVLSQTADGVVIKLDAETRPEKTYNAAGLLRGSDPKLASEAILLSAHLDHVGVRGTGTDTIMNGADDDASGCTAVLALAEAIAGGKRPKRTVIFAFFGSEEAGGFGSRHFADHPPVPLEQIVANLQFEMLGRPDAKVAPRTLWLTGYERSNLGPQLAKQGARLVQDPHPEENFFARSDNIQFAYRGVIAHTVSSYGLHKEYHTVADELRFIDFAHMTDAIRSMLAPILWLANSSFKPEWNPGMKPSRPAGRGRGAGPR